MLSLLDAEVSFIKRNKKEKKLPSLLCLTRPKKADANGWNSLFKEVSIFCAIN
jgi:hypothetical protein